jgi:hypothetical protein
MYEEPRELYLTFQIDTNRINARGKLENMNKLEHWHNEELITMHMSKVAHEEAMAGGNARRSRKALDSIYSYTMANTQEEQTALRKLGAVLFPPMPSTQNQWNDVEIAFNARKYGAVLVTADGDLLNRTVELHKLGVRVVTDEEAVTMVEHRITERDDRAKQAATAYGLPTPEWVGKDSLLTKIGHQTASSA